MKQLLENMIKEWWARPSVKIFPRELNLSTYLNLPVKKIISLIGFRRSGKTFHLLTLGQKIGKEKTIYLNFEDERIPKKVEVLTNLIDVSSELKGNQPLVLLMDEIQNIPNWESWARRVVETTNHQLFITGSSSKLSSAELPTQLRGRSLSIEIKPLNFKEFMIFKKANLKLLPKSQLLHFLREYLTYGGFPEIALVDEGKKPLILDEYHQTFLTRDIIERHKLRNRELLNTIINLLLNSSYYTISKLTNSLKSLDHNVSKATVSRYLSFLQESFFFKDLQLHTPSIKNRLKAERKPYFIDNFFLSRYSTAFSQNLGRLMENLVASNLKNAYYWKDYQNHEVDFVIRKEEKVTKLIQVSFINNQTDVSKRETQNLVKAGKQLYCQQLTLITWDLEKEIEINGSKVKLTPLHKWLTLLPNSFFSSSWQNRAGWEPE